MIRFDENKRQWDSRVLYRADIPGGNIYLEKNAFTYFLYNKDEVAALRPHRASDSSFNGTVHFHSFRAELYASNPNPEVTASGPSSYYKNYFTGSDSSRWAHEVRSYEEVTYREVYPSVDLHVYSRYSDLKYDFIVRPGGEPSNVKILYRGADCLSVSKGNLVIHTSLGDLVDQQPYAYQVVRGERKKTPCFFVLNGNEVSFVFPRGYDKSLPLVIDPVLVCSTFTGSTADNWGYTATYDNAGNIYTGGIAASFGYPTTMGAYQTSFAGGGSGGNNYPFDISITKFNSSGSALLYSTYLGGSENENPSSIIVDNNDELIIYGQTYSSNFPVTGGAYDVSYNGKADIIIAKFNSSGTSLVASTFIGGSNDDGVNINANFFTFGTLKFNYGDEARGDIEVDGSNNCYIASCTQSSNFPVSGGAAQGTFGGGTEDACVFSMNSSLSSLQWSTFLGGTSDDAAYSLALDASQYVYVTGGTCSSDFPSTAGVLNPSYQGGLADGFITYLMFNGTFVAYSTFIGTSAYDQSFFVQLDKNSNVYIYGQTKGSYPVSTGVYSNPGSSQFIHKLNPQLSATVYSTVFGTGSSTPNVSPAAFLVDTCENVYASGWGGSCLGLGANPGTTTGLPVTSNAFQSTTDGCDFYLFALNKNAVSLLYATFFGGNSLSKEHVDGGTSRFDKRGVIYQSVCAGCANSSNFPTTPGAWSNTNNSSNCNNAVFKFDFQLVTLLAKANASPSDTGCVPFTVNFSNTSTGAVNYLWDFGDGSPPDTAASPSHIFITPGTFNVKLVAVDSASCNIADSTMIVITALSSPQINLGNDTTLCGQNSLLLDAGNPGSTYLWNTNATTQSISVSGPGTYWVEADNGFCKDTDTIVVAFVFKPSIGNDTSVCPGAFIILDAGNPGSSYLWSTGDTSQTLSVSAPATYWVNITSGGCTQSDSIIVTFKNIPFVNLGNDTVLCSGGTLTLDAGNPGSVYIWSTGAGSQSIDVSQSASCWVIVTDTNGCSSGDTVTVTVPSLSGEMKEYTLCDSPYVMLDAGAPGSIYQWNTGASTQKIKVEAEGLYWVSIIASGCTFRDSMRVIGVAGDATIYFPNAFTPNGDGKNEIFTAYGEEITYFNLKIFNRWGTMIFETRDMEHGWDGKYKNEYVTNDVFVWVADFKSRCAGDRIIHKIGRVTVNK